MDFQSSPFSNTLFKKLFFLIKVFSFTNAIDKVLKPSKPKGNAQTSKHFGTESFFGIDIVTGIIHMSGVLLQLGHELPSYQPRLLDWN